MNGGRKEGRASACVVAGCGAVAVFVVLIASVAVLGFSLFQRGSSSFKPKIQAYWDAVNAGDLDEAVAMAGAHWRAEQSPEEIRAFLADAFERYGRCTEFGIRRVQYNTNMDGSFATITTRAEFVSGSGEVVFSWMKEGEDWVLTGVQYNVRAKDRPPVKGDSVLASTKPLRAAAPC